MWENARLPKWDKSETRFEEIIESVCPEGDEACFRLLGRVEDTLAAWWRTDDRSAATLHTTVCVVHERVCCDKNHGGPDCQPCPTGVGGQLCSGRGACPHDGYPQSAPAPASRPLPFCTRVPRH